MKKGNVAMKKDLIHPELPKVDIVIRETLIEDNEIVEKERLVSIPQEIIENDNENKNSTKESQ